MPEFVAALDAGGESRLIQRQPEVDLSGSLRPAYPGQTFDDLQSPMLPQAKKLGGVDCHAVTLRDAYLIVQPGCDGVVMDSTGRVIAETAHFADRGKLDELQSQLLSQAVELEGAVFVGVDTPWFNYFHWLCFGIGKCLLAEPHLDPACGYAFPDYDAYPGTPLHPRYRRDVWTGGLQLLDPDRRVHVLAPGIYRAPEITLLATEPRDPTAVTHLRALFPAFAAAGALRRGGPRRRALILRDKLPRLEPEVCERLEHLARERSFEVVRLEHMAFEEQIQLFANAEALVSPHGAGLTNLVFGPSDLKLLELNSDLDDGNSGLRPWFYILASGSGQSYRYLNGDVGDFEPTRLATALNRLVEPSEP